MTKHSYSAAALLIGLMVVGVDAFVVPSSLTTSSHIGITPLQLYLDTDGPNGHQTSPTAVAAVDPEIFQRALLKERLRLEGRLSPSKKNDEEELLHRALLRTQLDIKGKQSDTIGPVAAHSTPTTNEESLHRALLQTRLEIEAKEKQEPSDMVDELNQSPPLLSSNGPLPSKAQQVTLLDKLPDSKQAEELLLSMLDERRAEMNSRGPIILQPSSLVVDTSKSVQTRSFVKEKAAEAANPSSAYASFANQRALLEARLAMKANARTTAASSVGLAEAASENDPLLSGIDSSFANQRALLETRLMFEAKARHASFDDMTSGKSPVVNEIEAVAKPVVITTASKMDSSFTFQQALLEARLAFAARERNNDDDSIKSDDTVASTRNSRTPELAHQLVPPTSESVKVVKPVVVVKEKGVKPRKIKESYWKKVSHKDLSSALIKAFTPDKGIKELQNETDEELVGFAASRLLKGVLKGGKAAFLGLETVLTPESPPDPVVKAVADSTQSFVSAATALAAFGWRQGVRAGEYAKTELDKMETQKALERARELEEERIEREAILDTVRKEKEAIRLAYEAKLKELELEADEKVEEDRSIAEAMYHLEEEESFYADELSS